MHCCLSPRLGAQKAWLGQNTRLCALPRSGLNQLCLPWGVAGSRLAGLFCSPVGTSPALALGLNDSVQQGCEELHTPFTLFPRPWSALRVKEYGYTRLHILNGTHVHIQQVSDDQVSEQWPDHLLEKAGPVRSGVKWFKKWT